MGKKQFGRHLAVAGALFFAILCSGCAGTGSAETQTSQESTETPAFEMPGESVIEVTPEITETAEETTQQQTETIQIPVISSTEAQTTTAAETSGQPAAGDHIIVLDPGHGGVWLGALDGAYQEKDLALQTAIYCRQYLLEHYENVAVYLTRETDMEFSYDQKDDLEERVRLAASYNAEILVSLHFNSDPSDNVNGALVCVSKQSWVAVESAALGNSILNQLEQLGLNNRGLLMRDSDEYYDEYGQAMDYYAICRHSASFGIPGIIVEHCFMRNSIDFQFYSTDEALQRLAQADAIGIAQYLGLEEKE